MVRSDDGVLARVRESSPARRRSLLLLVALGIAAAIVGIVRAVAAQASVDNAFAGTGPMPTLPVHTYTQYTQHLATPDVGGLLVGAAIAVAGLLLIATAAVTAVATSRAA
jgi:hypothetical protein